jgi:hypothetical protein
VTRRVLRLVATLGILLGVLTAWRAWLLPSPQPGGVALPPTQVTLAYHVHTTRSDGTGTIEEVAAAAAAAGIQVVVVTDHGDGTRASDPPRFLDGVLIIDAAEIGTWGGHYAAIGAQPSPFPLGGDPASVVDDVTVERGIGVVAHPMSAKAGLAWRRWDLRFDAVEWLNADSEWRDRPRDLWSALLTYPWRPVETITALLDRPVSALAEWDRQTARRRVAGIAAHDAHARIGLRGLGEPYDGAVAARAPGYEVMFRAFANVAELYVPLPKDAATAATAVTRAIADGRTYAVITGQRALRPVTFEVSSSGGDPARFGEEVFDPRPDTPIAVRGEVDAPASATSRIVCDGVELASARGGVVTWAGVTAARGCRFEVDLGPPYRAPWVVTNPVYLRPALEPPPARDYSFTMSGELRGESWVPEHGAASSSTVVPSRPISDRVEFHWTLGDESSPYAAVRRDTPPDLGQYFGMFVAAEADRTMRLWIQLRAPHDGGRRWGKSLRLGPRGSALLRFDDFLPLDGQTGPIPLDQVTALLLVVDSVHSRRGDSGVVRLDRLVWAKYAR